MILSWNARGLGGSNKESHLENLTHKHKPEFVCMLESKCGISSVSFQLVRNYWGMADLD